MNQEHTPAPASKPPMTSLPPVRISSVPPPGPLMCFACVTATCQHRRCDGMIPAVTSFEGTALCLDCASATVDGLRSLSR